MRISWDIFENTLNFIAVFFIAVPHFDIKDLIQWILVTEIFLSHFLGEKDGKGL